MSPAIRSIRVQVEFTLPLNRSALAEATIGEIIDGLVLAEEAERRIALALEPLGATDLAQHAWWAVAALDPPGAP